MSIVVSKTRLPVTEWQTESGSVVSIANARRRDAKSAIVTLEPIQDLSHGDPSPTNLCPISGHSSVTAYRAGVNQSDNPTSITVQLGQTVYGGSVDLCSGVGTLTMANIASYNGETIGEPWLSSMDKYVAGATPTTGAQVVYTLANPITFQLTPNQLEMLERYNTIWADEGEIAVTYARIHS